MSDDKEEEDTKQQHAPKGPAPLCTPISRNGNLHTTTAREKNIHELASTGTKLLTQSPKLNIETAGNCGTLGGAMSFICGVYKGYKVRSRGAKEKGMVAPRGDRKTTLIHPGRFTGS